LGARCVEVVTNHRARQFGETKYGIGRTTRVVLDLLTVKFMLDYFASPMKLFGKLGMYVGAGGVAAFLTTVLMKVFSGTDMTGNPLLLMGVISVILRQPYQIRERLNFENEVGESHEDDHEDAPVILPFPKAA